MTRKNKASILKTRARRLKFIRKDIKHYLHSSSQREFINQITCINKILNLIGKGKRYNIKKYRALYNKVGLTINSIEEATCFEIYKMFEIFRNG